MSDDVKVSVLTPSLPERSVMLDECKRSVACQSYLTKEHLIQIDTPRNGCSITINRLANHADGEWLLPLADDDLLLPHAIETLISHSDGADIVYSPPLVWGIPDPWWFFQAPPAIPAVALIRASLWHDLGGYDETLVREEDRALWTRALEAGARFVRAGDRPTWVYRLGHGGNKSFAGQAT